MSVLPIKERTVKYIATHQKPDADALVASWLAARYLFNGEEAEIIFVARNYAVPADRPPDCVLDMGRANDPARLVFDHKPPALPDRNQTCAARLLWEHLLALGKPVQHLEQLIQIVHEGDRRPPRKPSPALLQSRREGLHAQVARLRQDCPDDQQLYQATRSWLEHYDQTTAAAVTAKERSCPTRTGNDSHPPREEGGQAWRERTDSNSTGGISLLRSFPVGKPPASGATQPEPAEG
jgi:hypothetical protein